MTPLLILLAIAGLPVLLALTLRVSSLCLFASVAAGALLVEYMGESVWLAVNMFFRGDSSQFIVQMALLMLPVSLTLLFARRSLPNSKLVLHFIPILATGLLLGVVALPLLPASLRSGIASQPLGATMRQSTNVIVGVSVFLNLGLMWQLNRSNHRSAAHPAKHHK